MKLLKADITDELLNLEFKNVHDTFEQKTFETSNAEFKLLEYDSFIEMKVTIEYYYSKLAGEWLESSKKIPKFKYSIYLEGEPVEGIELTFDEDKFLNEIELN